MTEGNIYLCRLANTVNIVFINCPFENLLMIELLNNLVQKTQYVILLLHTFENKEYLASKPFFL